MEQSLFFVFDSILIFLIITIILNLAKKRRGKRGKEYEKDRIQTIKESYGTERKQFRSKEPSIDCSDNLTDEERKGFVGEKEIYDQIKQVQEIGAKVIWNCWLRYPNNGLTQVDIVLVWKSGIYVIESKNWSGCRVYGSEDDDNWTLCWSNWKGEIVKTIKQNSPVKQNANHVDCIRKMTFNSVPIYSIIALSDSCRLSKIPGKTKDTAVIKYSDLRETIAEYHTSGNRTCLSLDDVERVYKLLKSCNDGVTEEEKKRHIRNIKEKYKTIES